MWPHPRSSSLRSSLTILSLTGRSHTRSLAERRALTTSHTHAHEAYALSLVPLSLPPSPPSPLQNLLSIPPPFLLFHLSLAKTPHLYWSLYLTHASKHTSSCLSVATACLPPSTLLSSYLSLPTFTSSPFSAFLPSSVLRQGGSPARPQLHVAHEDRLQVLQMCKDGRISQEEAAKLLGDFEKKLELDAEEEEEEEPLKVSQVFMYPFLCHRRVVLVD